MQFLDAVKGLVDGAVKLAGAERGFGARIMSGLFRKTGFVDVSSPVTFSILQVCHDPQLFEVFRDFDLAKFSCTCWRRTSPCSYGLAVVDARNRLGWRLPNSLCCRCQIQAYYFRFAVFCLAYTYVIPAAGFLEDHFTCDDLCAQNIITL